MLDMSKAFDTVQRGTLFEDLKTILNDDELHMISILLKDVQLAIRCGKETGDPFTTNIGVPQGDCLSPVLFTLYLAKALENDKNRRTTDHQYAQPPWTSAEDLLAHHIKDHTYSSPSENSITINQQYADDIGWISNSKYSIDRALHTIPSKLKARNLNINETKTEIYDIKRNGPDDWKHCKYLGSLIDTEEDIR